MKSLTATLCLLALACNTALATAGGISYCMEKGSDGQLSFGCAQKSPDPCCANEDARSRDFARHLADCDVCVDGEIEASEIDNATASFDRLAIKAPLTVAWTLAGYRLFRLPKRSFEARPLARPPPFELSASQQYANTVQFRC